MTEGANALDGELALTWGEEGDSAREARSSVATKVRQAGALAGSMGRTREVAEERVGWSCAWLQSIEVRHGQLG